MYRRSCPIHGVIGCIAMNGMPLRFSCRRSPWKYKLLTLWQSSARMHRICLECFSCSKMTKRTWILSSKSWRSIWLRRSTMPMKDTSSTEWNRERAKPSSSSRLCDYKQRGASLVIWLTSYPETASWLASLIMTSGKDYWVIWQLSFRNLWASAGQASTHHNGSKKLQRNADSLRRHEETQTDDQEEAYFRDKRTSTKQAWT